MTRPPLGAALLAQVFRQDLQHWPRNGWGLLGLEKSLRAQGKVQQAEDVKRQRATAWARSDVALDLAWFLSRQAVSRPTSPPPTPLP